MTVVDGAPAVVVVRDDLEGRLALSPVLYVRRKALLLEEGRGDPARLFDTSQKRAM